MREPSPVAFRALLRHEPSLRCLPGSATTCGVFATLANVGWGQIVRAQSEGGKVIGVAAAS